MKEIEDVNLKELVENVSQDLLTERRKQAAGIIKQQLQKIEQLVKDISNTEKDLKKKKEKLTKAQDKIDKVKGGNWQILSEIDNQKEKSDQ